MTASSPPTLDEACAILLQNEDPIVFQQATECLFKALQNVLQHPEEAKYRSLRRSSKGFAEKLRPAKGAVRFLRACGFIERGENDEAAFVLPDEADTEHLVNAKAALKAVVKQHMAVTQRALEAARQRENQEVPACLALASRTAFLCLTP